MTRPWPSLVVDEGQLAKVNGTVVRHGEHFSVCSDADIGARKPGSSPTSRNVPVRSGPTGQDLALLEGLHVMAVGHWSNGALDVIDTHLVVSESTETAQAAAVSLDASSDRLTPGSLTSGGPAMRLEVERELMQSEYLVDLWEVESGPQAGRHVALVTDVERVREVLKPIYNEQLDIVRARWGPRTLLAIEGTFCAEESLLVSLGNETGSDNQLLVKAVLLHLPTRLARLLNQFPEDAITLDVLVEPA